MATAPAFLDTTMPSSPFAVLQSIETKPVAFCDICGSGETVTSGSGFDYEYQTCSNSWKVVQCSQCDFMWLNPRPTTAALPVIYPNNYYSYDEQLGVHPLALAAKKLIDGLKIKRILKHLKREAESETTPLCYLDVGCGDGRYLEAAKDSDSRATQLYGLELNSRQAELLNKKGLKVYCDRVEDCRRFEASSLDLITLFHVIEHVESPRQVIKSLSLWLKKGGILAVETPNTNSLDFRLFQKSYWGGYHFPRHWTFFEARSLVRLLEEEGFFVEDIQYKTGHSFWLFSFHHYLKYKAERPTSAKFFHPLKSLVMLTFFTGFDMVRAALGFKTSSILVIARRK